MLAQADIGSPFGELGAARDVDHGHFRPLIVFAGSRPARKRESSPRTLDTARAALESAELDLEHTVVRAPFDGIASKVPEPGAYVTPGSPVMGLVSDKSIWVEANYKETELTHVAPGQSVEIRIDTYPGQTWHGKVQSIAQATGAEFSVIPAQNASGNWVKVTQRIPVRIALDIGAGDPPLRAGMSAVIDIDTRYVRTSPSLLSFLVRKPEPLPEAVAGRD